MNETYSRTFSPCVGPSDVLRHGNINPAQTLDLRPNSSVGNLLDRIVDGKIVQPEEWQSLPTETQFQIRHSANTDQLLARMMEQQLLTEYQASRVQAGTIFGLVLGNYRVLERIGAGGMGVVFKAEHILMRRLVAIKVLPLSREQDSRLLMRFLSEMRAIAALEHPNIVKAMDAGQVVHVEPDLPILHYLVMEYVVGKDLEEMVLCDGPLEVAPACHLIHQVACALDAAYSRHMVHRDLKPSNVLITDDHRAKLLDFGLARDLRLQLTEPGAMLGTIEYMAPEQAIDAANVDIRADIYGLGGTLFWALTGQQPFPPRNSIPMELTRRRVEPAPSLRSRNPNLPVELDKVVAQMLAPNPEQRYPNPKVVMRALEPFARNGSGSSAEIPLPGLQAGWTAMNAAPSAAGGDTKRIIVIDDDDGIRTFCKVVFAKESIAVDEAIDGPTALAMLSETPYDVALLDLNIPLMSGEEVLRVIRSVALDRNMRVILISGGPSSDELAKMLLEGADDFLSKPFSIAQLRARVKASMRLKAALDQADSIQGHMQRLIRDLERSLCQRDSDLISVRNGLVLGLATLVGHRSTETESHLKRIQAYCKVLAQHAAEHPSFTGQIDDDFVRNLECCSPLHDIGVVALPDHILIKPSKLTVEERVIVESHTHIGAEILNKVMQRHGSSMIFLQMAVDVARHHHERFDGSGYPDSLQGDAIPLSARLLAVADVYDALRSRRPYRPALSHNSAMQVMTQGSPGKFDPQLIEILKQIGGKFEEIFTKIQE